MRLKFTQDANIQIGTAEGITTYAHNAGDVAELPDDVAALFLQQGAAEPAPAQKATKPRGTTAAKK